MIILNFVNHVPLLYLWIRMYPYPVGAFSVLSEYGIQQVSVEQTADGELLRKRIAILSVLENLLQVTYPYMQQTNYAFF